MERDWKREFFDLSIEFDKIRIENIKLKAEIKTLIGIQSTKCEHPNMRFCMCNEKDCGQFYCPDCGADGLGKKS